MRAWKLLLSPALFVLFLALPDVRAEDAPAYIGIHKPLTSTAMILIPQDEKNFTQPIERKWKSQGSGFVIDYPAGLVVTNHHVASDVVKGGKFFAVFPAYDQVQARADRSYYMTKAQLYKGRVLAADALHDLALLQLDNLPRDVAEIKLASESAKPDDRIHTSGNPGDVNRAFVYTPGKMNANAKAGEFRKNKIGLPGVQDDCRVFAITTQEGRWFHGVSGGPVINQQAELVGVVFAGPDQGGPIAFCIDIKEVRSFLGEAHRKLASSAIAKKEYGRAVDYCTRGLEFNPRDPLTLNERGVAYSYQDSYDKAIADYTAALKIDPKLPRSFRSRGSAYFHKGQFDKTVKDCTDALALDPKYALAYLWRGKALAKLGKADEAAADRAKALKLDPSLQ